MGWMDVPGFLSTSALTKTRRNGGELLTPHALLNASWADLKHFGGRRNIGERRRIGAGHENLRAKFIERVVERRAAAGIEMRHHFVEQQHRREAGHLGDQARVRENESD